MSPSGRFFGVANFAVEVTVGSRPLAPAAHRGRSAAYASLESQYFEWETVPDAQRHVAC
jgi:hypothetical protein